MNPADVNFRRAALGAVVLSIVVVIAGLVWLAENVKP